MTEICIKFPPSLPDSSIVLRAEPDQKSRNPKTKTYVGSSSAFLFLLFCTTSPPPPPLPPPPPPPSLHPPQRFALGSALCTNVSKNAGNHSPALTGLCTASRCVHSSELASPSLCPGVLIQMKASSAARPVCVVNGTPSPASARLQGKSLAG